MANLMLLTILMSVYLAGLLGVVVTSKRYIEARVAKDLWLGDAANAIANIERRVAQANMELEILFHSCPAILALPPLASQTALKAARAESRRVAKVQRALRLQVHSNIAQARARKYIVTSRLPKNRLPSICGFKGPFVYNVFSVVRIRDAMAGVSIPILASNTEWRFEHPRSGGPWF